MYKLSAALFFRLMIFFCCSTTCYCLLCWVLVFGTRFTSYFFSFYLNVDWLKSNYVFSILRRTHTHTIIKIEKKIPIKRWFDWFFPLTNQTIFCWSFFFSSLIAKNKKDKIRWFAREKVKKNKNKNENRKYYTSRLCFFFPAIWICVCLRWSKNRTHTHTSVQIAPNLLHLEIQLA